MVLCVFRGAKHERDFHKRFRHLRHHGEFYLFSKEVRDYIFSDELAPHRMTREEAETLSPRIERTVDRIRREKRDAQGLLLDAIKAVEMEPSLETNE